MNDETPLTIQYILDDIYAERQRQNDKWGEQNHPIGNGQQSDIDLAIRAKETCEEATLRGEVTWRHILNEEIAEIYAETEPSRLREEMIQSAAVIVAMLECLDRQNLFKIKDKH